MQRKQQTNEQLAQNKAFQLKRYNPQACLDRYSYMLIRPPRFLYCEQILNPSIRYKNKFEHYVFEIPFKLSLYCPRNIKYVLLYLHGNSSSRYEGFSQLHHLPPDVALACFDFNGCGNRIEKQFISLGKYESKEVDIAVKFLKQKGHKVAVWGRSMGAISALLSEESNVIISDSAFSSLYQTSKQLAKTQVCCPLYCCFQCFFPCFFCFVGKDVEKKSLMNPGELQIKQHIAKSNLNRFILLLAANNDKMIDPKHTEILFNSFPGKNKKKIIFEGTHNSERPRQIFNEIFSFAESSLFKDKIDNQSTNNIKNQQIDSLQCVRNDKMVSIQMPSQLGVNQTIKVIGTSEKGNIQTQQ